MALSGCQWVEHRCLNTRALRASLLIENMMQCKNMPFQIFTTSLFPAGNVASLWVESGKCSTFLFQSVMLLFVRSRRVRFGWKGEEVRRQGQTLFGGRLACLLSSRRDWQIGATAAPARMPSHAFPQKSVYQRCLSRATAMTSNHRRAGTS